MARSVEVLERFDAFLSGLIDHFELHSTTVVLISDHGNIEDLSTKSHTRNSVPCLVLGRERERFASSVKNLTHITPSVLSLLA